MKDYQGTNRRSGLSRFIVPHDSFGWATKRIWLMAVGTSIFLGGVTWFHQYHLFNALSISELSMQGEIVERYMRFTVFNSIVVAVAYTVYITLAAAYLFHRISGPTYRLKSHMEAVIAGTATSECSLREGDQLQDVCEAYNQLLYTFDVLEPKSLPEAEPPESR